MTNNVVFLLCSPQASWGGERTPLGAPKNHENAQRRKWLIARTEINRRMRTGWAVVSASRPVTVKVRLWMSGRERPSRVRRVWPPSHRVPPDLRQSRCRSLHIRCACDDGRGQNHAGPEPRWPRPVDARDPLLTPRPTARPPQGQWRKPTGPGGGGRCACTSGISRRSSPELASGRLPEHFDR